MGEGPPERGRERERRGVKGRGGEGREGRKGRGEKEGKGRKGEGLSSRTKILATALSSFIIR